MKAEFKKTNRKMVRISDENAKNIFDARLNGAKTQKNKPETKNFNANAHN